MKSRDALCLLALMTFSQPVAAATMGYSLLIDGNQDRPNFLITNTSTSDQITSLSFTIGDPSRNFDRVIPARMVNPAGGSITLTFGSLTNGGTTPTTRTSLIAFAFTGFDAGETSAFRTELDRGNTDNGQNYRTVFFNNGILPNSVLTLGFASGRTLQQTLADGASNASSYSFSQSVPAPVPLPASGLLLGLAIGAAGLAGYRRRTTPAALVR